MDAFMLSLFIAVCGLFIPFITLHALCYIFPRAEIKINLMTHASMLWILIVLYFI